MATSGSGLEPFSGSGLEPFTLVAELSAFGSVGFDNFQSNLNLRISRGTVSFSGELR